jgi:hypothetical protein
MTYIAYKTAKNDPNLPNGFIIEHFETDKDTLEGYVVVSLEIFNAIFQNNVVLLRAAENNKGVTSQHPNVPLPELKPASDVEHVPSDFAAKVAPAANAELFNQFLTWLAANKPPGNT